MSKIPKNMGRKVQEEFQDVLEEWREEVFTEESTGYLKNRRVQKIELGDK